MALPSSGALSFWAIQAEMGGSNPIRMTEYYGWSGLPSSGTISVSNFRGKSKPAGSSTYTTPGTYTWTCPAGVSSVTICMIGGGGSGANYYPGARQGGGYAGTIKTGTYSVSAGSSYTVVVGSGGVKAVSNAGYSGSQSKFGSWTASGGAGGGSISSGHYNGNGGSRSTCRGTFRDGYIGGGDSRFKGGQAGLANGGDARSYGSGGTAPTPSYGSGSGNFDSRRCVGARGGHGYVKITWG